MVWVPREPASSPPPPSCICSLFINSHLSTSAHSRYDLIAFSSPTQRTRLLFVFPRLHAPSFHIRCFLALSPPYVSSIPAVTPPDDSPAFQPATSPSSSRCSENSNYDPNKPERCLLHLHLHHLPLSRLRPLHDSRRPLPPRLLAACARPSELHHDLIPPDDSSIHSLILSLHF